MQPLMKLSLAKVKPELLIKKFSLEPMHKILNWKSFFGVAFSHVSNPTMKMWLKLPKIRILSNIF